MDSQLRRFCGFDGFLNFTKGAQFGAEDTYSDLCKKYAEYLSGLKIHNKDSAEFVKGLAQLCLRGYLPIIAEKGIFITDRRPGAELARDYVCFLLPLNNEPTFTREAATDDRFTEYLIDYETELKQRREEIKKDNDQNNQKFGPIEAKNVAFDFQKRRSKSVCIDEPERYFNFMMLRFPCDMLTYLPERITKEIINKYIAVHVCDNEFGAHDRLFPFLNAIFDRFKPETFK